MLEKKMWDPSFFLLIKEKNPFSFFWAVRFSVNAYVEYQRLWTQI